jgi:predicted ribosome quality control (RQC) complex YloA/Tae2 family protein
VSLSDVEIAHVVAELGPRLVGASLGKVIDLDPQTLLLELGKERLLLAIHPRASRIASAGPQKLGHQPSAFAMLLRKQLSGLRLHGLALLPAERVVSLTFGPGQPSLRAELTGPHANVILVDAAGKVVSTMRPSSSTTRPLGPGEPYTEPAPAPATARWRGGSRFGTGTGTAARVAAHYAAVLAEEESARLRAELGAALTRLITRGERRLLALAQDLARAEAAAAYRKYGDLLLAHLHELPRRGATSVTLADDFEEGAPLIIPLEPTLDGKANAARYYAQHRRLAAGKQRIIERLAQTRTALAQARVRAAALPELDLLALRREVAAVPAALRGVQPPPRSRRDEAPLLPYREARASSGEAILIGRNAADNDRLTFSVARGTDIWLHTRDAPGAHVIVRVPRAKHGISEATLAEAALLAAHFSPLSGEEQVDITWTQVKHLRKPKGAPPGLVYVSEARTVRVRRDAERVSRLLSGPDLLAPAPG